MTLTEILTDVASHIGMTISTNTRVTTTEATAWVNQGYRKACSALAKVNVNYFNGEEVEGDTDDDVAEYTLPTDFLAMKRVEIRYGDGEDRARATPLDINQLQGTTADDDSFSEDNPFYYLWENKITFKPTPTDDSSAWETNPGEAYKLWYFEMPADLSGSNSPVIPSAYHDILAFYAAMTAFYGKLKDEKSGGIFEGRWERGLAKMVSENTAKDQNKPMAFTIVRGRSTSAGIWRP
jgi:hypothetical protein